MSARYITRRQAEQYIDDICAIVEKRLIMIESRFGTEATSTIRANVDAIAAKHRADINQIVRDHAERN